MATEGNMVGPDRRAAASAFEPHKRQFVMAAVGPEPTGWLRKELADGLHLSHCPDLRVTSGRTRTGIPFHFLGEPSRLSTAVGRIAAIESPEPSRQLADSVYHLGGKWALLFDRWLITDAAGLMPVFFGRNPRQELCIGSSLQLLVDLQFDGLNPRSTRTPVWGRPIDWFPPPGTPFLGIAKLLPGQVLDRTCGETRAFSRTAIGRVRSLTFSAKVSLLRDHLHAQVSSMAEDGAQLLLPLTAGLDSRTILSVLLEGKHRFATFTQQRRGMPHADATVPRQISGSIGFKHTFIPAARDDLERRAKFDRHVGGAVSDAERSCFARGQFDFMDNPNQRIVASNCWEIGRCFYYDRLAAAEISELRTRRDMAAALKPLRILSYREEIFDGLLRWTKLYRDGLPEQFDDWRDLFYLDQRLCGWRSLCDQFYDGLPGSLVQLASSQAMLDLLLSCTEIERRRGALQRGLIQQCAPRLLEFPLNPRKSWGDRVRARTGTARRVALDLGNVWRDAFARRASV